MTDPIDPTTLTLLVALEESGSITSAARRLGLSQPAASVRLRELEAHLGLELLERATRGARLSDDGLALVPSARAALLALDEVAAVARRRREERGGVLRLAASLTVAEYLLPGWIAPLYDATPPVTVSLRMANSRGVAALVESGEAEIGFVEGLHLPRGLEGRGVHLDELVVVVAPGHPWARRRSPVPASGLAASALVGRETGSGTREVLEGALAERGLAPHYAVELASTTAVKEAVARGIGPAVVSRLAVEGEIAGGRLVVVPVSGLRLTRSIRALWRAGTTLSSASRRLLAAAD